MISLCDSAFNFSKALKEASSFKLAEGAKGAKVAKEIASKYVEVAKLLKLAIESYKSCGLFLRSDLFSESFAIAEKVAIFFELVAIGYTSEGGYLGRKNRFFKITNVACKAYAAKKATPSVCLSEAIESAKTFEANKVDECYETYKAVFAKYSIFLTTDDHSAFKKFYAECEGDKSATKAIQEYKEACMDAEDFITTRFGYEELAFFRTMIQSGI